jgi:hypothetical protein
MVKICVGILFYCEALIFAKLTNEEVQILENMEKDELYKTIQEVYQQRIQSTILAQSVESNHEVKMKVFCFSRVSFCFCLVLPDLFFSDQVQHNAHIVLKSPHLGKSKNRYKKGVLFFGQNSIFEPVLKNFLNKSNCFVER